MHEEYPVLGSWSTNPEGWGAPQQLDNLVWDYPTMPIIRLDEPDIIDTVTPEEEELILKAQEKRLPICIRTNQPEGMFLKRPQDYSNVRMVLGGVEQPKLTSAGDVSQWQLVGRQWAIKAKLQQIVALYPNPPAVYWLSNNEATKPKRQEQGDCELFQAKFGTINDWHVHSLSDKLWATLYQAMFNSIRVELEVYSQHWADSIQFIGYGNQGNIYDGADWYPNITPTDAWKDGLFNYHWGPGVWDGGGSSFYISASEDERPTHLKGGQGNLMTEVPYQRWAREQNDRWENWSSVWKGSSSSLRQLQEQYGLAFDSHLYRGWCRLLMFLVQPSVLLHFETHTTNRDDWALNDDDWAAVGSAFNVRETHHDYYLAAQQAVDDYYTNKWVIRSMGWELVESPYDQPMPWKSHDKIQGPLAGTRPFYQLPVNVNPPYADWWVVPGRYGNIPIDTWAVARANKTRTVIYTWSMYDDKEVVVTAGNRDTVICAKREGNYTAIRNKR